LTLVVEVFISGLDILNILRRRRIEERASLKHRNASRFLQEQAKRAKLTKDKDIQVLFQAHDPDRVSVPFRPQTLQ